MAANTKHVYLCGPMEELDHARMTGWRQDVTEGLAAAGLSVFDPTVRAPFREGGVSSKEIVSKDLREILSSDVVLANLLQDDVQALGSGMELMYAYLFNVPMVVVIAEGRDHPFLNVMCNHIYNDIESAVEAVIKITNS